MSNEEFWRWVDQEIVKRELSYYRIEQIAGLSNAAVSRLAREQRSPTLTACEAIAKAFQIPIETVFRRAGILPTVTTAKEEREILLHYFDQLSSADQERLLAIARTLATERVEYKIEPRDAN